MATDKEIAAFETRLVRVQRCLDQDWKLLEAVQESYGSLLSCQVPIGTIRTCVALINMQCSFNAAQRILEEMK